MSTEATTVTIGEATTVTVSANTGPRGPAGDQTAAELLTAIKTVDGTGSGLDADTVDGVEAAALAPLASPTFTGVPAAPTATAGANSTQIATTAYVDNATSSALVVVDAGVDLSTARPAGAAAVLWQFDAGVDVGTEGANVTNGVVGDLYFVASA